MPWFIALTAPVGNGTETAIVQFFPTEADFTTATNINAIKSGPHQNEFATQAQAQSAANKWNSQPVSQRQATSNSPAPGSTSGVGFSAPNIPGAGTIDDLIHWLGQGNIWVRVGEFAVGALLLYIGLKAVVTPGNSSTPVRGTAKKTAKKVVKKVVKK